MCESYHCCSLTDSNGSHCKFYSCLVYLQIKSVRPLMEQDWPSLYGLNEKFWAHEWEKHGTCAEDDFPTQLDYFNTTLALHVANSLEVHTGPCIALKQMLGGGVLT